MTDENELEICLSREELEWIKRICKRSIFLSDKVPDIKVIFDPEYNENLEKAKILCNKIHSALMLDEAYRD